MPVLKRRAQIHLENSKPVNGLYIHSSPPRVLNLSSAHIKQIIRSGDVDKLEQIVLEGHGKKLIGEYSADYKTRTFLKSIPNLISKLALLHDAVNSARLEELKAILDEEPEKKKKYVLAKDESGVGLLHKAVYYDLKGIYKYLIEKFPHMVTMKDSEGRTAYHYTVMCKDPATVQKMLANAGADPAVLDFRQKSAKYYSHHNDELELPNTHKTPGNTRKSTARRECLNFKKSNIRIWIHQRNLTNLQQVCWEGHGSKLLVEHSNNPKIKRFLEAIPHIMGLIKDVHSDVQNDDLDSLKARVSPPVPPVVLSGKDSNGLTPLHKAAGLGKQDIAEFIVSEYPNSVNLVDNEGRTPLHYAALPKDDGQMMNFLIEHGADESALDNKQKTAAYYKGRNSELDAKLLTVLPECPRSAKENFGANFDWSMLTASTPTEELGKHMKKVFVDNNNHKPADEAKSEEPVENGNSDQEETKATDNGHAEDDNAEDVDKNNNEENNETGTNEQIENHEEAASEENKENDKPEEKEEPESSTDRESPTKIPQGDNSEENEKEGNTDESNEEENKQNDENNEQESAEVDHPDSKDLPTEVELINEDDDKAKSRPGTATRPRPVSRYVAKTAVNQNKQEENPVVDSEGVIEGVVNGENEVETLNEQGQGANEDDEKTDEEIQELVASGNMEQLAAMVLNGEGERLIGQQSDNPELQSFLDNVTVYMNKINKIHLAARDGSLRDLQAALDRRKFAIAKDNISANGASPLHVAVVFGNTSIVRYLAGRFPETVHVADSNGRTPLHYAAVLHDNGHYYNLLVHLGANTRTEDNLGHTPEYYRTNQEEMSHRSLLTDFGAEEQIADEILTDKVGEGDVWSARKDLDDEDMLQVLERCYNVLHGRRSSNTVSAASTATTSSIMSTTSTPLLTKHVRRYVFDTVKRRLTRLDHNLYDLIWPSVKKLPTEASFRTSLEHDFPAGIVAPDFYVYKVFAELLVPIVKDFNSIDLHFDMAPHPATKFVELAEAEEGQEEEIVDVELDLDPHCKWIISDNKITAGNGQVDMPFFATEEGRYLASSLGDPLIKGLTEVANKRPADPIAYLATYLYNFANNRTNLRSRGQAQDQEQALREPPKEVEAVNGVPATIDVVTVEPEENEDDDDSAFTSTSRDEHGQSMLHFAAARSHGRNALFQLLLETAINVAYRDELYRTARDISIQANIPENTAEIDKYVVHIATKGDTDKLVELLLDGYEHITDITDEEGVPVGEAVAKSDQPDTEAFLQSILTFEEKRERVHHAIRLGSLNEVTTLLADENDTGSGKLLALGKNSYGRCTLHIAVLCQQEEIVDYLVNTFPDTLRLGDNRRSRERQSLQRVILERTALHYAMGVEKMDTISRVLIKAGAKRVVKDLKGRQPSYYYLNKSDILRLQEEEETF